MNIPLFIAVTDNDNKKDDEKIKQNDFVHNYNEKNVLATPIQLHLIAWCVCAPWDTYSYGRCLLVLKCYGRVYNNHCEKTVYILLYLTCGQERV